MKILMVLTSHDKLGNTGEKTGFWPEEFASPYYAFNDAGAEMTLVSPLGGQGTSGKAVLSRQLDQTTKAPLFKHRSFRSLVAQLDVSRKPPLPRRK